MAQLHTLLKRQLKRHFGENFDVPKAWQGFIDAVNNAYLESDIDRGMLERSLDLSSQELVQANSEMRALFQAIPDLFFRLDSQGTILDYKAGVKTDFLLHPDELLGKRIQDIPVEHIGDQFRDALRQLQETRSIVGIEYSLILHEQEFFYEARLVPLPDDEIVVIIRNITERRQAQEELVESEEKLKAILQGSPIPQFVIDKSHKVIYWNKALEEITRISARETVGTNQHWRAFYIEERPCLADLLVEKDIEKIPFWYGRDYGEVKLIEGAYEGVGFFPALGKEGVWLHFTAVAIRDIKGTIIGAMETLEDITESVKAEKALKLAEKKYRGIFENAVMGIFQATPDGRYLSVNPAGAIMYGYDSPEDMIQSVTNSAQQIYVYAEDRKRLLKLLETHGSVEGLEVEHYRKDGSKIWASMNARLVRDARGTTYEITSENITARKLLEAQLLQAQKMEAVGTLAGGVAHDFNNILTALMGYASLIEMGMDKTDPLRTYLDQILACTRKATNLTQSLLAFGRKQLMELKPHKLTTIVKDVEKLLRRLLPEDIELTLSLIDDTVVMADMTQIDQVLMNFATNARDAMPNGGELRIETTRTEINDDFQRIYGFGKPGPYSVLSVSDTGIGMDEATQKKIFEPFFTTKEVGKGTGLGLSIVYGIIKQHDGYIFVSSQPNRGTTFTIYLPAVREEVPEIEAAPAHIVGGIETILFAEDNADIRWTSGEILRMAGYTVIEAADGGDAVVKFVKHKGTIDLLIFDVVMPIKNGKEAYDEIRAMKRDMKVLFTSGYTGDVVLGKGVQDGTFDYISKPLSPDMLLKKVRKVLDN